MLHPLTGFVLIPLVVTISLRLDDTLLLALLQGVSLAWMLSRSLWIRRLRQWCLVLGPLAIGLVLVHMRWSELWRGVPFEELLPGLVPSIHLWLRIGSVLACALWWLAITPTERIVKAMFASRLPPGMAYLLVSPLLLAEQLKTRLAVVQEAQAARGLDIHGPWYQRSTQLLSLAFPLLLWTLSEVNDRAAALETRAFRRYTRRTTLDSPVAAPWERWFVRTTLVVILLILGSFVWH